MAMASNKPSIQRDRDFNPEQMVRRNYIFDTIRSVFSITAPTHRNACHGEPLHPAGKYSERVNKTTLRFLSGDFLERLTPAQPDQQLNAVSLAICEKGLRYDLTFPLPALCSVSMILCFPLSATRYSLFGGRQTAKRTLQEFYQCDVDVMDPPRFSNKVVVLIINGCFNG